MAEECTHDCSTCQADCASRKMSREEMLEKLGEGSEVKKVIAVMSGKGGVGKSLITSLLACQLRRAGKRVAILDADITGPSIPKAFGVTEKATGNGNTIFPVKTKSGIEMMSLNLLLENETDPVVWRGPVIAGTVKQFWTDVLWDKVDIMFIDMPPGTGDVPLTVFQSIPVNGIIVVTSPQELVSVIVEKAVKMAEMMDIPMLGVIENYSYALCPDCGKKIEVFGESHLKQVSTEYHLPVLAQLPIDPALAASVDRGRIENVTSLDKQLLPARDAVLAL